MKKHFLLFIFLAAITLVSGVGLSYWFFENTQVLESKEEDLYNDDILENYSYGNGQSQDNNQTYTIYLFPSTIYLKYYLNYLENPTKTKPEDLYGYVQPQIDKRGNPVTDSDGSVIYDIHSKNEGDNGYYNEVKNNTLYRGSREASVYDTPYQNSSIWRNRDYRYGDPELDQTVLNFFGNATTNGKYNYRNMHDYDRFGYWSSFAKDSGRWLPIKITIDENFSNDVYASVAKRPRIDMGDPRHWYVYSFSGWSYIKHTQDSKGNWSYQIPYFTTLNKENLELSPLFPSDVSLLFELTKQYKEFADKDGIIRLFPKFSNGKGYDQTSIPKNGGRDAVRMRVEYSDNALAAFKNENDIYLSYLENNNTVTYNGVSPVKVLTFPNLLLRNYKKIDFQIDIVNGGLANWPGNWQTMYSFNQDTINAILDDSGKGFYNIYLFIGNCEGGSGATSSSNINNIYQDAMKNINGAEFSFLKGKKLRTFDSFGAYSGKTMQQSYYNYRPVRLVYEKIRDIRIVTDITTTETIIEQPLEQKYNESYRQIFQLTDSKVYPVESSYNSIEKISSVTPINETYPYIYMLKNVDFTELSTRRFQIRLTSEYLTEPEFAPIQSSDEFFKYDMIFEPTIDESTDTGIFTKDQRFVSAVRDGEAGYFTITTEPVALEDGKTETQLFFELKGEDMLGVYDFMLLYMSGKIYLYTYRHTNVFLKILANDITDKEDGFLCHEIEKWKKDNALIFQKEYPIGMKLRHEDKNEVPGQRSVNGFNWWDNVSQENQTLETCLNNYVDDWLKQNAGKTRQDVILRDHVTDSIIAYYDDAGKLQFMNFKIRKNYIFYVTFKDS